MEQINSNGALAAVKRRIDSEFKWKRILNVWQRVAAVLIIPLILFSVYQNLLPSQESEVVWNEVRTPYGLISKIMLPDSTVVELNGRSKLKYPLIFSGDERVVELDGEAFFKVKTNQENAVIVKLQYYRNTSGRYIIQCFENGVGGSSNLCYLKEK